MELDILKVIAKIATALAGLSVIAPNFSRDWTPKKSAPSTPLHSFVSRVKLSTREKGAAVT